MGRRLMRVRNGLAGVLLMGALAVVAAQPAAPASAVGQWRTYGGDLASTRYSSLDQITAENFGTLRIAWHSSAKAGA